MKASMETIFQKNQKILHLIDLSVTSFHVQNLDKGLRYGNQILDLFGELVRDYVEQGEAFSQTGLVQIDVAQINEMLVQIMSAQQDQDYVLLADLLELIYQRYSRQCSAMYRKKNYMMMELMPLSFVPMGNILW